LNDAAPTAPAVPIAPAAPTAPDAPLIRTHFFHFERSDFSNDFNYQWIVDTQSRYNFAFSSDKDLDTGNELTGGKNSKYELTKLDLSDPKTPKKVAAFQIDLAFEKDSKFRILDFRTSSAKSTLNDSLIYLSYASNDLESRCRYLNLVSFNANQIGNLEVTNFKRLFRSPCMPGSDNRDFRLHVSGGAILEKINSNNQIAEVYLTVGDFLKLGFSGEKISNSAKSILGSLIRILPNRKFEVIASGFRNPQGIGLYRTLSGVFIIQTEHGPRGGDELNVVVKGNHYGWPAYSLGTQYEPNDPLNQPNAKNTLGTSTAPLFAWLPSIGPSKVGQVTSKTLREYWSDSANKKYGDILVAGMGSQTIYRLRVKDSKVIYVEPIYLGFRVRTMAETNTGEFIFGTDSGIKILKMVERWDSSGVFRKISDS
jgi:hypothetical protein